MTPRWSRGVLPKERDREVTGCDRFSVGIASVVMGLMLWPQGVRAQSQHPVSFDVTIGGGFGHGGPHLRLRGAVAADALLGLKVAPMFGGRGLLGISTGWQGSIAGADEPAGCLIRPGGACDDSYPMFLSTTALAGIELGRSHGATARLLAGPAYFREDEGETTFGMQARLDASTPVVLHISFVASARASVLPNFRGDVYSLSTFAVGIRIR